MLPGWSHSYLIHNLWELIKLNSIKQYLRDCKSSLSSRAHISYRQKNLNIFLFTIYIKIYNNRCHQLNSPFISWPQINIPVSFRPSSDQIPIINQVHFTKVITQVVIHPLPQWLLWKNMSSWVDRVLPCIVTSPLTQNHGRKHHVLES